MRTLFFAILFTFIFPIFAFCGSDLTFETQIEKQLGFSQKDKELKCRILIEDAWMAIAENNLREAEERCQDVLNILHDDFFYSKTAHKKFEAEVWKMRNSEISTGIFDSELNSLEAKLDQDKDRDAVTYNKLRSYEKIALVLKKFIVKIRQDCEELENCDKTEIAGLSTENRQYLDSLLAQTDRLLLELAELKDEEKPAIMFEKPWP